MPLFFSTGTNGYLYDTYRSQGLILSYNYTSDCIGAVHTNSLLYTITGIGMEIFTSRLHAFITDCAKEMFKSCKISEIEHTTKAGY